MPNDADAVEWFSIDEGLDTSPVSPAIAGQLFAELGATGFASWKPFDGTLVAVVMQDGRVAGSGATARELAASVAGRTGAEVQWGPIAAGPHGGWIAPSRKRNAASETPGPRSIYVLPASLEELGVDRWLPRDTAHAVSPTRVAHVVLEGRSVLVTDEHGSWKWAKHVRPVVEVTAYANGSALGVWVPSGYVEARQNPWLSGVPDLYLCWWQVVQFGDAATVEGELTALRAELSELWHDSDAAIDGVLAELGRSHEDAAALRALAEEPWSDATPHRIISVLGLPAAAADLLRDGAPVDAEAIPLKRGWLQALRPRPRGRGLVA